MITFGGIPFVQPLPDALAEIERAITLRDVYEFVDPMFPAFAQIQFASGLKLNSSLEINLLSWPVHASRWATFHGLVNETDLTAMRQKAAVAGTATLILQTGTANKISPLMSMLPARPLFQGTKPEQNLYILTLVDVRFWWWFKSAVIAPATSWATLLTDIGLALGETITADTIDASYVPGSDLISLGDPLPVLLDAAAASFGHRVVRDPRNGTVKTMSPTTAKAQDLAQALWVKQGGGTFLYDAKPAPVYGLPASVTLTFPRANASIVQPTASYSLSKSLSTLTLTGFSSLMGMPNTTKPIRSSAIADFVGGAAPSNNVALTALTTQAAKDWYLWNLPVYDMSLAGIFPWTPSGFYDLRWRIQKDSAETRLTPLPMTSQSQMILGQNAGNGSAITVNWNSTGSGNITNNNNTYNVNGTFVLNGTVNGTINVNVNGTLNINSSFNGTLNINNSVNGTINNNNPTYYGSYTVNNNGTIVNNNGSNCCVPLGVISFTGGTGSGSAYPWSVLYRGPYAVGDTCCRVPDGGTLDFNPVLAVNQTLNLPSGRAMLFGIPGQSITNATLTATSGLNGTINLASLLVQGAFYFQYSDGNGTQNSTVVSTWASGSTMNTALASLGPPLMNNTQISPSGSQTRQNPFTITANALNPASSLSIVGYGANSTLYFMDHPYKPEDKQYGLYNVDSTYQGGGGNWLYNVSLLGEPQGGSGTNQTGLRSINDVPLPAGSIVEGFQDMNTGSLSGLRLYAGTIPNSDNTTYSTSWTSGVPGTVKVALDRINASLTLAGFPP